MAKNLRKRRIQKMGLTDLFILKDALRGVTKFFQVPTKPVKKSRGRFRGSANELVPEVTERLERLANRLELDVKLSLPNGSGKRNGKGNSAHDYGIAVDIRIDGMDTVQLADELIIEGFSGIGEYYAMDGTRRNFAHGDIRGLPGSEKAGKYARDPDAKDQRYRIPHSWHRIGPKGRKHRYPGRKSKGSPIPTRETIEGGKLDSDVTVR